MDEAKETAETKGELSREDVHDILQAQKRPKTEDACSVVPDSHSGARSELHTLRARLPQGNAPEV